VISTRQIAGSVLVGLLSAAALSATNRPTSRPLPTTREVPNAFGTEVYTVTTISATAFYPDTSDFTSYDTASSLGRYSTTNFISEFYAALDLPGGAVIDYIGLNSSTDADYAYGVSLLKRHKDGNSTAIASLSSTAHGWDTDFNAAPIGYVWNGQTGDELAINVEEDSEPNNEYFGWVEVWWRLSVSPPPATASFNDVPPSHPFFQYIEALKASGITGGCSANPPLFCPDNSLTRGQMAVFLSKALGLHWPGQVTNTFGTIDYTVTTIPAVAFYPGTRTSDPFFDSYDTSFADFGRWGSNNPIVEFYAALDLPGGAVIDYIGLNSWSDTDGVLGADLIQRHKDGALADVVSISNTIHGWATDFNSAPVGYTWSGQTGDALVLNVGSVTQPNPEYFGWVEVWWKRSISPPPPTATFNDVPTTDPFFQFVEALKASGITSGCSVSPPLYCPNSSLTRGQMAVFLAKALGLHWPGY